MIRINYGINKKKRGNRFTHSQGKLELPHFTPEQWADSPDSERLHTAIRKEITDRHPGWSITGYALVEDGDEGDLKMPNTETEEDNDVHHISCSRCGRPTTFDSTYGDLCYRCIRADNE